MSIYEGDCIFIILLLFKLYSAGGLVTAVAPVVIDCDGLWVGWTGLDDFNTGNFPLKRFLKKFFYEKNIIKFFGALSNAQFF